MLPLTDTVGAGGRNHPADVRLVQQRLIELGFNFFGTADGVSTTGLVMTLKLFQGIIAGRDVVMGDGLVNLNGRTHTWLGARNAPRWILMPVSGAGFENRERLDHADQHDFGTDWLAATIAAAGEHYQATFRSSNPGAAPITVNDVSLPHGGNTPDHAGHETGLACDLYLPRLDGKAGGIVWSSANFDRNATRATIQSLRAQPQVATVLFNDPTLIGEGLCHSHAGHDNHIHFGIKPPAPLPG